MRIATEADISGFRLKRAGNSGLNWAIDFGENLATRRPKLESCQAQCVHADLYLIPLKCSFRDLFEFINSSTTLAPICEKSIKNIYALRNLT